MAQLASSKEYESWVDLNLGTLASLDPQSVPDSFLIDHEGTTISGTGLFSTKFYLNGSQTVFDTQNSLIDQKPSFRKFPVLGQVKQLRMRMGFDGAGTADKNDFRIKGLIPRVTVHNREGSV